jgi:hypothetical protein
MKRKPEASDAAQPYSGRMNAKAKPPHPADASQLPSFSAKAPTDALIARIRDLFLVVTTEAEGDYRTHPPAGNPSVELVPSLTVTEIPPADSELVMNACSPRGHYFIPVRQFGTRHAFVLDIDPIAYDHERFQWDPDHLLFHALLLSRLVRDNSYSLTFAARVVDHEDGNQQVIPARVPVYDVTYRLRRDRDWLTSEEAIQLGELLEAFRGIPDRPPWPVVHALNLGEDAVHLRIGQRALLLIVTGLEGLVNTSRRRATNQFVRRVPLLAEEVGIEGVTRDFVDELYTARSEAAHGTPVSLFQPKPPLREGVPDAPQDVQHEEPPEPPIEPAAAEVLAKAQELLRAATRRAILDPAFRAIFSSPENVDARWPVDG